MTTLVTIKDKVAISNVSDKTNLYEEALKKKDLYTVLAKFWRGKFWRINGSKVFGEEKFGELLVVY